jgi:hypothetical protein
VCACPADRKAGWAGTRGPAFANAGLPAAGTACDQHQRQGGIPGDGIPARWALWQGRKWAGYARPYVYWSGTEYAPNPNNAWNFNTNDGNQNNDNKNNELYAWAVRPGD